MKKEELLEIGLTEEQIKSVQALSGKDVQAEKDKTAKATEEKDAIKKQLDDMSAEVETLKKSNASAEEWQKKFEDLDAKVKADEEARETARKKAEKEEILNTRYNAVCVDKNGKPLNWSHPAIAESYKAKFAEALEDKANTGKSDAEIFSNLTKDDATAFTNVVAVNLAGGRPLGMTGTKTKAEISAIKDPIERQKAIKENINLYQKTEE